MGMDIKVKEAEKIWTVQEAGPYKYFICPDCFTAALDK